MSIYSLCSVIRPVLIRLLRTSAFASMPKKSRKETAATGQADISGPITEDKSGAIAVKIFAKPGAKQNSITDIGEEVSVQIAAPAVNNKANQELLKFITKVLGLKKSQVTLEGSRSRNKRIIVTEASRDYIHQRLKEEKEHH